MSLIKFNSAKNPYGLDTFFNDFFEGEFFPQSRMKSGSLPAANIRESENAFHVELAAPGMKKDDFKIELSDDLLSIRTEKKAETEEREGKYTKREFNYTSFVRSFQLPEDVDVEKISAEYKDGVLSLDIPKMEIEQKSKTRQIAIK
ncbi:MAG: Hsp20/alpha crystallin family protein [Cryomorphaceae bacterium]|nr:Hsp20/alpha crystallin family protein [Flavobacteriales bacterium]